VDEFEKRLRLSVLADRYPGDKIREIRIRWRQTTSTIGTAADSCRAMVEHLEHGRRTPGLGAGLRILEVIAALDDPRLPQAVELLADIDSLAEDRA
jgi:hypothetical protein